MKQLFALGIAWILFWITIHLPPLSSVHYMALKILLGAWNLVFGGFVMPMVIVTTLYVLAVAVRETARHLREL
jgi:hypothetical protein